MALFETMRQNTKVILWVTVIAFVALIFLAWGANFTTRNRRAGPESGVLARVNGERILISDFDQALEQARATYEEQTGRQPDENLYLMLQASTWDQLVESALLRREAARRGITATEKEITMAMLQNPLPRYRGNKAFQNEQGQFDLRRYQSWLADPQTNTLPLEREYDDLIRQEKLRMQVLTGVKVSENEVHQAWLDQNQRLDLAYAQIPYARQTVPEEVDDATLQSFMQQHAGDYQLPEQVSLEYVTLPKVPTLTDSIQAHSEIEEAYNEYKRGEDYLVLVQSYSQAPTEHWGGPNAPYLDRTQMGPGTLADAAFSLPIGEVSPILDAPDGFHIIRVEDRKNENGTDKVRIAEIFVPLKISYDTNMSLRERALNLADSTEAVGFRPAAEGMGFKVKETGPFSPEGFVPGLGRLEAAREFAKQARPLTNSKPIETSNAWYVLRLVERRPSRPAMLEEVRARARAAYLLEQRKQAAKSAAEALLARCQSGVPLETAAQGTPQVIYQKAEGLTRQGAIPGVGRDSNLMEAAFGASQPGLIPHVILGSQGAFAVDVLSRPAVDEAAFSEKKADLRARLLRDRQNRLVSDWVRTLKEGARIEDFRQVVASM